MIYYAEEVKDLKKNISISTLNSGNMIELFDNLNDIKKKVSNAKFYEHLFDIHIHIDIMDGKFVKNTGVDLTHIKIAKENGFYVDTHLMVESPILDKYIENAIVYGTDELTIHYEIENFEETLNYLNLRRNKILKEKNKELVIGVAIKPSTPVEELIKYKNLFSKLLIMTVEPGYGGQEYIKEVNEKIKKARVLFDNHVIQIDGGVNADTMEKPLRIGVDSFVMGMYLVKLSQEKLYDKLISLSIKKDIEELPKDVNMEFEKTILQIVEGGYAQDDILIGINVPNIRKVANYWYKHINYHILDDYISSSYHEYRRFAIYTLSNMIRNYEKNIHDKKEAKQNKENIAKVNEYMEKNICYINNWDLTDEVGPNVTAKYFQYTLSSKEIKEKLVEYIHSNDIWKKRIGIVSLLPFAKDGNDKLVFFLIDKVIYDEFHLFQKASGWVLRELYKSKGSIVVEYLKEKNKKKKIPNILLSYACEKMSKEEKNIVRLIN